MPSPDSDFGLTLLPQAHGVKAEQLNPKKNPSKALRPFLELRPLRVFGSLLDVRQKVTHYLETIFYNLTTVALYDWSVGWCWGRLYAPVRAPLPSPP